MFTIRRVAGHESYQIASIHRASRLDAMPWLPELHSPEDDQKYFTQVLRAQECWLAEVDDKIIAFAV